MLAFSSIHYANDLRVLQWLSEKVGPVCFSSLRCSKLT